MNNKTVSLSDKNNFQTEDEKNSAKKLISITKKLAFILAENEKKNAELLKTTSELTFQLLEKEKLASELVLANKELKFQNSEKEKRASELLIANIELTYQNKEKEKRASELLNANKELEAFTFISSHDLQEPLRKIQTFSSRILSEEHVSLSSKGKYYFERMQYSALHMQTLINDLIAYSRTNKKEIKYEKVELNNVVKEVMVTLGQELKKKKATVEVPQNCELNIIKFQFHQLIQNLISNSIKFCKTDVNPHITIKGECVKYDPSNSNNCLLKEDYCHISINDNGIGFDPKFKHKIFEVFQRLHENDQYKGTGIGLTIVRKIVENHNGIITSTSEIDGGAQFDIYIPSN